MGGKHSGKISPKSLCTYLHCDYLIYSGPLEYWNTGILEYWNTGILEYWSTGILEYWNTGILEYWNTGILEYWNTGILEYWNTGILEYWNTGILEYWNTYLSLFENFRTPKPTLHPPNPFRLIYYTAFHCFRLWVLCFVRNLY